MSPKTSSIVNYFSKRKPITDDEIYFLDSVFIEKKYFKNEIVVKKNQICNDIFFIDIGVLKTYFIDENNKEAINGIAIDNNFCTSVSSFVNQTPSSEIIKALEDTILITISFSDFKELINRYPVYKDIYVKILEDYLTFMTWRIESVMLMDSVERYKTLMKIFPKLFLRVSNHDIAKYLGMSPETLSRIKSKR